MAKKYEHWCDKMHDGKDSKFVIGEMAENFYNDLERYLLHDISKDMLVNFEDEVQEKMSRNYVVKKLYNILDNAEKLELTVKNANSVYGFYDIDLAFRRQQWLVSRGLCFEMIAQLNHISNITMKKTNVQKYITKCNELETIASKIYNVMKSDDEKRKKHIKEFAKT